MGIYPEEAQIAIIAAIEVIKGYVAYEAIAAKSHHPVGLFFLKDSLGCFHLPDYSLLMQNPILFFAFKGCRVSCHRDRDGFSFAGRR